MWRLVCSNLAKLCGCCFLLNMLFVISRNLLCKHRLKFLLKVFLKVAKLLVHLFIKCLLVKLRLYLLLYLLWIWYWLLYYFFLLWLLCTVLVINDICLNWNEWLVLLIWCYHCCSLYFIWWIWFNGLWLSSWPFLNTLNSLVNNDIPFAFYIFILKRYSHWHNVCWL